MNLTPNRALSTDKYLQRLKIYQQQVLPIKYHYANPPHKNKITQKGKAANTLLLKKRICELANEIKNVL